VAEGTQIARGSGASNGMARIVTARKKRRFPRSARRRWPDWEPSILHRSNPNLTPPAPIRAFRERLDEFLRFRPRSKRLRHKKPRKHCEFFGKFPTQRNRDFFRITGNYFCQSGNFQVESGKLTSRASRHNRTLLFGCVSSSYVAAQESRSCRRAARQVLRFTFRNSAS
jgi:hypothetical protein